MFVPMVISASHSIKLWGIVYQLSNQSHKYKLTHVDWNDVVFIYVVCNSKFPVVIGWHTNMLLTIVFFFFVIRFIDSDWGYYLRYYLLRNCDKMDA